MLSQISFELSRGVIGKKLRLWNRMAQGARVRTPTKTVLGHEMAGDVKSALKLFRLEIRLQRK